MSKNLNVDAARAHSRAVQVFSKATIENLQDIQSLPRRSLAEMAALTNRSSDKSPADPQVCAVKLDVEAI